MDRYVRIRNHPDLVKDKKTGAVLNTNSEEIRIAKKKKQQLIRDKKELQSLRNEVKEMKQLLIKVLEEKDGDHNC
tara:strand:- start:102 stop:326 length:225 start_codon:yes stop_codon:yes gene_type:complete